MATSTYHTQIDYRHTKTHGHTILTDILYWFDYLVCPKQKIN